MESIIVSKNIAKHFSWCLKISNFLRFTWFKGVAVVAVFPDRPVGGGRLALCVAGRRVLWRPSRVLARIALGHPSGSVLTPSWLTAEPK